MMAELYVYNIALSDYTDEYQADLRTIIEKYYPLLISSCQITCLICVVLCIASVFASFVGIKSDSVES